MTNMKLPPGPWNDEPDELTFVELGLKCRVIRAPLGYLCGYVSVPKWHPLIEGSSASYRQIGVHGGITYSGLKTSVALSPSSYLDGNFYLGFDCAHSTDLIPGMGANNVMQYRNIEDMQYRNIEYVRQQVIFLARSIIETGE